MRIAGILDLHPSDTQDPNLAIRNLKNDSPERGVDVPRKLLVRLTGSVKTNDIGEVLRLLT